jgi:DNA replication protein DnaC
MTHKPIHFPVTTANLSLVRQNGSGRRAGPEPVNNGFGDPGCPKCHGLGYWSWDVPVGHPEFGRAHSCECRRDEVARVRAAQLPALANLLPNELELRLDSLAGRRGLAPAALQAAREFAREPSGMLTFWGGAPEGRSALLMALVNDFNERRFGQARYLRFSELAEAMRAGSRKDADLEAVEQFQRLKSLWFLAIDVADGVELAEWAEEFRARILEERRRLAAARMGHTALAIEGDPLDLPPLIYARLAWGTGRAGGFRVVKNE